MYMNCAVVNIIGARSSKRAVQDTENADYVSASAQAALRSLPDLYVANLASINSCKTVETVDPVFDNPGADVAYGDDISPSYSKTPGKSNKNQCTGLGRESAGYSTSPSTSSPSGSSGGDNGQWYGGDNSQVTNANGKTSNSISGGDDGQWHGGDNSQTTNTNGKNSNGGSKKPLNCNDGT